MKSNKNIPQYEPLINYKELDKSFSDYFKSKPYLTEYKKTEEFENEIKKFLGVKYCFMVNNGTISLSLALLAEGIKPGDKIIVPAVSMIATANAVKFIGAEPIFIDIDSDTLCLDSELTLKAIYSDKSIKAVIYVSLNGRYNSTKAKSLRIKCQEMNIAYIEDNAQSFGSKNRYGMIGNDYHISSFSFSMPKIITTGQGGCLVTNNSCLAKRIKHLKDFGRESGGNDIHNYFGINSKITDLQAIAGLEQMKDIKWRVKRKKEIYSLYQKLLWGISDINLFKTDLDTVTPWFVDIYVTKREQLIEYLKKNNIGTRKIYPIIAHQKIYNTKEKFPVADYYSNYGLWLPSSLTLIDKEIEYICEKIKEFYER